MKKIVFIAIGLLINLSTYSQVTYNKEFQINTYTNDNQSNTKVLSMTNGGFIFCWESYGQDGSSLGIYAQIYDENGKRIGSEFKVNNYTNFNQYNFCFANLTSGKFVICWESWKQDGSQNSIIAQVFNQNGNKLGSEISVNSLTENNQSFPAICPLDNGGFVVCWQSVFQTGILYNINTWDIFAQIYDESGTPVGSEFLINSFLLYAQTNPGIYLLSNSTFIVYWISHEQDDSGYGIYAKLFNENGEQYGNEFRINTTTLNHQTGPKFTALSNGNFVITWVSEDQDGSGSGIFAQIFDVSGDRLGVEFQVNSYTNGNQKNPCIEGLENGGFIISWNSFGQDGSKEGIYAQIYNNYGIKIGEEFRVNSYVRNNQKDHKIIAHRNGGFGVSWNSEGQDGSGYGVYAQLYKHTGEKVGKEFCVNSYTYNNQQVCGFTQLNNGNFVASWISNLQDGSKKGIFGKYFLESPIEHNLKSFKLIEPTFDCILNVSNPVFRWNDASDRMSNFSWELTYELYIDNNEFFSTPLIIDSIHSPNFQIDSLTPNQTYFWKVLARNFGGDSLWSSDVFGFYIDPDAVTNLTEIEAPLPEEFNLCQNYPNPFNPTTKIKFTIPVADALNASATLKIYDILGNEITTLVDEFKQPGTYEVEFDSKGLTSGIYFYKLQVGKYSKTKKMLLMK